MPFDGRPEPEASPHDEARLLSAEAETSTGDAPSRVPNNFIGKLLDQGKSSAAALKLLAIKFALGGAGFVVSERRAANYGMSRRQYQHGLKLLKARSILARWQEGQRSYSRERLVTGPSRGYVEIDAALLTLPTKVVAFILAAKLSPNATTPAELCRRLGVTSDATIRKITNAAIEAGAVAVPRSRKGSHLVARLGTVFDGGQNGESAKNNTAKTDTALSDRKISSETERDSPTALESSLRRGRATELFGGQPVEALIEELRTADIAGALADNLLTPKGIKGYLDLVRQHGALATSVVRAKLAAFAMDGVTAGKIWTWTYFNGPIADEVKFNSMAEHGERPGDLFGFHRAIKLED